MLNSSVVSTRSRVLGRAMKCQNEKLEEPRLVKKESPMMSAKTGTSSRRKTMSDTKRSILELYVPPTRFQVGYAPKMALKVSLQAPVFLKSAVFAYAFVSL